MKTIQINNKHYQECDVVILESSKPSNIVLNTLNNRLLIDYDKTLVEKILPINAKNQHLYILSDEEIKEGDWRYDFNFNKLTRGIGESKTYIKKHCKKIIATTDSSLQIPDYNNYHIDYNPSKTLPQIPQQFIEHYINEFNKGNVISKVLVEFNPFTPNNGINLNNGYHNSIEINQNNEISVLTEQKQYPIGGYAQGFYTCKCVTCRKEFMGDKRAVQCEPCAIQMINTKVEVNNDNGVEIAKQETLEEAATDYIAAKSSRAREYGLVYDAIKFGAEWQAERSFSGEEVEKLLNQFYVDFAAYPTSNLEAKNNWIKENLKK